MSYCIYTMKHTEEAMQDEGFFDFDDGMSAEDFLREIEDED